ncbi:MAG: hypothetical protein QOH73_906, partial [Gaiellaceae bacterium]|nr:hypothetical protein [Gaiellaceae bacterium]
MSLSHGDRRVARRLISALGVTAVALALTGASVAASHQAGRASAAPDFGPNVKVFDPSMTTADIKASVDAIATEQVDNEFGTQRYTLLFKPGTYGTPADPLNFQVGYYTEVAGLGSSPGDVVINGTIDVYNRCVGPGNCIALVNFWRSLANLTINVYKAGDCHYGEFWATSQATSLRRVHVNGYATFMDYCSGPSYASGGFMADSQFSGSTIVNGSQQQYLVRNSDLDGWTNGVWNQVFAGVVNAPAQGFPDPPYTTLATNPVSREKPFLTMDGSGNYSVFVPDAQANGSGTTWAGGSTPGHSLPISSFFVAKPSDSVEVINDALADGKSLILTPGIYNVDRTIRVKKAGAVVLGLGLATLAPQNGVVPMT